MPFPVPKFQDLSEIEDRHIRPIVALLCKGKKQAAYARFERLCASVHDCVHTEAMELAQRIFAQVRAA